MLLILYGSLVGIITGLLIEFNLLIALCFLSVVLCYTFKIDLKKTCVCLICIFLFFIYTNLEIKKYDTKYTNGNMNDNFKIISYDDEGTYYHKYICKNSKGDKFLIYLQNNGALKKGDMIYAVGEYVLPDLSRNTGGFNYRRYLNSQKIYGSIFVKEFYLTEVRKFNLIYYIQDEINQSFAKLFPENEMGIILGMMIGETKDISEDILESFKNTGITHLIAVSGSNVMYVLTCVQFIFQKICGKRKTYFISIIFLIIFMLISGASSSVVRATVMTTLMILANIFYQKSDTISNIAISAFILVMINPLILYDVGFILSFGGTLGIVLFSKDFQKYFQKFGPLSETLATTCSAQFFLTPIMAYFFNTFSILAILTNLIVVPISGFITILGVIIFIISKIFFPLAILLSKSLYILVHFTILISQIFSKIPFSNIRIITPNIFEIIIFYFMIFFFFEKIKLPFISKNAKAKFIIGILSVLIVLEMIYYNFSKNYIDVSCIDVGQGDAIYIQSNYNKNILVDGGGSKTYDVGEKILLPFLLDKRVIYIDSIFSSHSDADHLNGILTAVKNLKVGKVYIAKHALGYEELYEIAEKRKTKIIELELGDVVKIDDLIFTVIGPTNNSNNKDVNAYSLVIKMEYKNKSMLFTGDINQETELKLQNVKANILKVAHHGSNTSSAIQFIANVNPEISVIQVGKANKYGHPSKEVISILKKFSKVYTTAEKGEIKIKIFKDDIKVE
ncbi:MAG: DNA internalization-related competence protein ComEC/Rec2 [Clostridia bacterium]|nr:DNA internalization-related competence protein ComEC/Rec2 [Clostridia bacterium]